MLAEMDAWTVIDISWIIDYLHLQAINMQYAISGLLQSEPIAQLCLQEPLYRQLMAHQIWSRFRLEFK